MIHTETTVRSLQPIAGVLILAICMWAVGLPSVFHIADAANVIEFSDTLSDSDPSVGSDHTLQFELATAMAIGETFTVTFPGGFDTSEITLSDVDLASSSADQTLAASAAAGTWGVTGLGTDAITFETPTDAGVSAGAVIEIQIGTNAAGGANQIVNPTAGSYEITVDGTMTDTGRTRVVIIDNVLVTAEVSTSFTFTITGVADGASVNSSPTTTATTTTATALPFEILNAGTSKTLAQDLAVTTNAANGFVVTVEQDQNLLSSTGADIDGFIDGAYTDTPAAWTAPSNDIGDEHTWGHWGLTSQDTDLEGAGIDFGADQWIAASTTPRAIFAHNGPSDGTTAGAGATRIGYQAQISPLQEAGEDYTTTLTYIATPTF